MTSVQSQGEKPLWSVLVSSFDDSCDLWPLFFHYFFKLWPDAPTPVYLVTNFRKYDDERVVSLCVGKDTSWGDTIRAALAQVPSKHVWMLLDDFFLTEPISTERIDATVRAWDAIGGKYLETGRQGDIGELVPGTDLRRITSENPQAGINSAVYDCDFLRSLAKPGASLWKANSELKMLNLDNHPGLYYLRNGVPPMISFMESVKGKFWKPDAVEFLKKTGVKPDLWWRPFPFQGQDPIRKIIRSFHKRRMDMRKRRHEKRFAAGVQPPLVRPGVRGW